MALAITDLRLRPFTVSRLRCAKINDAEELAKTSEVCLGDIRSFGAQSLSDVKEALRRLGREIPERHGPGQNYRSPTCPLCVQQEKRSEETNSTAPGAEAIRFVAFHIVNDSEERVSPLVFTVGPSGHVSFADGHSVPKGILSGFGWWCTLIESDNPEEVRRRAGDLFAPGTPITRPVGEGTVWSEFRRLNELVSVRPAGSDPETTARALLGRADALGLRAVRNLFRDAG